MKDFFIQTRKKVFKAIDSLTALEKRENCNSLQDAVIIASCKSDLILANKMLDILIGLHTNGKVDTASFLTEYYKRKTERGKEKNDCYFNDFYYENVFLYSFKNQLN